MSSNKIPKGATNRDGDDSSSTRRRILTGGIVTGLTLPVLPGKWSRPVVQSVLLPAHARTSPSPCLTTLDLPGCSVSCNDDDDIEVESTFQIAVSEEGCLLVTPGESGTEDTVRITCHTRNDGVFAQIVVVPEGGTQERDLDALSEQCAATPCDPGDVAFGPAPVAGGQAEVTAQLSTTCGDNPTASVSNIVVMLI